MKVYLSVLVLCIALASANPKPSISLVKDALGKKGSRVIGGTEASLGEFPWQASLQQSGRHFCGASLISAYHLISAAHCYNNFVDVALGALDYRQPEQVIRAISFVRHPFYNAATIDFDYSVLTLYSAANMIGNVDKIKLVEVDKEYTGTGTISGWGYTQYGSPSPYIMQTTNVPLVSYLQCQSMWASRFKITNQMQCIGGDGKVTICMGDSGGPLTVQDNGETILIGAASWTENYCDPVLPGAFAKLSVVRSWIDSLTNCVQC